MCTAATYKTKDLYFGRTLDYDFSYGEEITVTPRQYPFNFGSIGEMSEHYALIGTAHIADGYPLYYDAVNEKGLCMAGLNFAVSAVYHAHKDGKDNIAQYEFIPWVLGQCSDLTQARALLNKINLTGESFKNRFPTAKLHWIIADESGALTVESVSDGIKVYDNDVGILTNEPSFEWHMLNLKNYMGLSSEPAENRFSASLELKANSRGMGALGLPGDLSSQSRFVRASFVKMNSVSGDGETESVSQFFHILGSVDQQRGCCCLDDGKYEISIYTSCCNASKGIYYYTAYDSHQINAVDMNREDLDAKELVRYKMITDEKINFQN